MWLVLLVGHLAFKGSKTSHFIMKSYFYKSVRTLEECFKTLYFQPLTSWRLLVAITYSPIQVADSMVVLLCSTPCIVCLRKQIISNLNFW